MCCLCLEVGRCRQVSWKAAVTPTCSIPTEPSLNRGCSAGTASPRRSSGAAAGRWKLNTGRAPARRAREAARGTKDAAILRFRAIGIGLVMGISAASQCVNCPQERLARWPILDGVIPSRAAKPAGLRLRLPLAACPGTACSSLKDTLLETLGCGIYRRRNYLLPPREHRHRAECEI